MKTCESIYQQLQDQLTNPKMRWNDFKLYFYVFSQMRYFTHSGRDGGGGLEMKHVVLFVEGYANIFLISGWLKHVLLVWTWFINDLQKIIKHIVHHQTNVVVFNLFARWQETFADAGDGDRAGNRDQKQFHPPPNIRFVCSFSLIHHWFVFLYKIIKNNQRYDVVFLENPGRRLLLLPGMGLGEK